MLRYKAVSRSGLECRNVFCRVFTETDMGKESEKSTRLESEETEGIITSTDEISPDSQATLDKWLQENKQVREIICHFKTFFRQNGKNQFFILLVTNSIAYLVAASTFLNTKIIDGSVENILLQ